MKKEVIEQDRKEIFEFWQIQETKFEKEKLELIEGHDIENLEEDESSFGFDISGCEGNFVFDFGNADPDPENPDNDGAVEFATDYIDLLDAIHSDVCVFIADLRYDEWDADIYYTAWRKDEWVITVPNYPAGINTITIEEVKK